MMKNIKTICPGFTLAASILGLALVATPSYALTPPALTLAVTGYGSVTVDSSGSTTYVAPCTAANCVGTLTVGNGSNGYKTGQLNWAGSIGPFTQIFVTGQAPPAESGSIIDVLVTAPNTSSTSGTLQVSWTATGLAVGESPATMTVTNGAGATSATYISYVDSTNAAFGTGTTVNTLTAAGTATGPGPSKNPFSMTNVETVTVAASTSFSADFSLQVAPHPPLALSCTGLAAGTVGVAYTATLSATGGVPPYKNYLITGGSISPLALNATSGAITGTPTQAGTLSFTASVTDSSGNVGANTATASSCSIIITTPKTNPPLKITCPASSATVGTYYSSTVGATGGNGVYTFSIAFGTLPAGLTLNTKTGAITGTPTTAGTGSFKIEVTDTAGDVAYTNCSGSCSGGVQVTYGGSTPQNGYGQKGTSCSYSSNGIPLNVYGYDTKGNACNLYSSYVSGGPSLGLANWNNQNQIDGGHFVQFDISAHNSSGATGTSINVTSTEWNATFDVYGSNTQGSLGTLLASNVQASLSGYQSIPNANNYHYICVKGHQGDVAIACLQFTYTCACAIDVVQSQGQCNTNQNGNDWWNGNGGGGNNGGQGANPGQCGW